MSSKTLAYLEKILKKQNGGMLPSNKKKRVEIVDLTLSNNATGYIDLTGDDDDLPNIVPVAVEEAKDDEIPNIRDYYSTIDKAYDSDRVYLAPSTLGVEAGLGLFAKINFKDNDYICAYVGDVFFLFNSS